MVLGARGEGVFSSPEHKEQAVKSASAVLRAATAAMKGGGESTATGLLTPQRMAAAADTLREGLYDDTITLPLWLQVHGRIALESFNLTADPEAVNYKEIRKALRSCAKAEAFHDAYFLICAEGVAAKARADGENKAAQLYTMYAILATNTLFGGAPNYFAPELYAQLAELAAEDGNVADAGKYYGKMATMMPADYEDRVALLGQAACFFYDARDYAAMEGAYGMCVEAFEGGSGTAADFVGTAPVLNAPTMGREAAERALAAAEGRADRGDVADMCALAIFRAKAGQTERAYATADSVRAMSDAAIAAADELQAVLLTDRVSAMYSHLGDVQAAVEYLRESLEPTERVFGPLDPSIPRNMRKLLASFLQLQSENRESVELLNRCLADKGLSDRERYEIERGLMQAQLAGGNYERTVVMADELGGRAPNAEERRQLLTDKAAALVSLADVAYDDDAGARAAAIGELRRTVAALDELCDSDFADDAEARVMQLMYAATAGFLDNDNEAMLAAADSCEAVVRTRISNPAMAAGYLASLAMYHIKAGSYDRAAALLGEETPGRGELSVERLYRTQMLSEIALGRGEQEKARGLYAAHCADIVAMTEGRLGGMTEGERAAYWRMYSKQIQDAGRYAGDAAGRPSEFGAAVYDMELFAKGLLLNSSLGLRRAVERSGDKALTEKYDRFARLSRSLQGNALSAYEKEARAAEAERLEMELMKDCRAYGDYAMRMKADWKAVQAALGKGDAAVEFVQYSDPDRHSYLGAAVVTRELEMPVFVALGSEDEVADAIELDFDGTALWGPLARYFTPGGRVYFSAAGYLHRLPVESCVPEDVRCDFFRVSSTRELLRGPQAVARGGAVLFGDIDYGGNAERRGDGRREGAAELSPLPGTRAELDGIVAVLPRESTEMVTGKEATRAKLLGLSHKGVRLLHVATHGYAEAPETAQSELGAAFVPVSQEDRSLRGCGLYFAGANDGDAAEHCVNAAELGAMDLSGLELVVLSACETARGAISGEGVFGLQRGFKLAGAQSIVMSLWKVDDAATAALMTEFYRQLQAGAGKHAALEAAKAAVRARTEWSAPEFWAAFVLLDGGLKN